MKKINLNTYLLNETESITTPSLLLYPDLVKANIAQILKQISTDKLRPHIKTIKNIELIDMLMKEGIHKFKCATLTESKLLGEAGAKDVIIAYPLVGSHIDKFLELREIYPNTYFQLIIDNVETANILNQKVKANKAEQDIFIDVNLGMNRTGVSINNLDDFYDELLKFTALKVIGLHGYDGHIREKNFNKREEETKLIFERVLTIAKGIEERNSVKLKFVFGGSNTFPIYRQYPFVECSPGTFVLWDYGYHSTLPEQYFAPAAIIISRVVSKPTLSTVCIDLGYKAIASENSLENRFYILNKSSWITISHSEEHLVLELSKDEWESTNIGDLMYVVPYHICPTVAMYPYYQLVKNFAVLEQWKITQRY